MDLTTGAYWRAACTLSYRTGISVGKQLHLRLIIERSALHNSTTSDDLPRLVQHLGYSHHSVLSFVSCRLPTELRENNVSVVCVFLFKAGWGGPRTCLNLFNLDLAVQAPLLSPDVFKLAHYEPRTVGKRLLASYWNAFL